MRWIVQAYLFLFDQSPRSSCDESLRLRCNLEHIGAGDSTWNDFASFLQLDKVSARPSADTELYVFVYVACAEAVPCDPGDLVEFSLKLVLERNRFSSSEDA